MPRTDQLDLLLAHRYRCSLQNAPRQSNFRVAALIFLKEETVNEAKGCTPLLCWSNDRPYLLGTNSEACWIGNSICAERSALALLRWFPSAKVSKIVIATDAPGPIAPGCLCREFMASCDQIPWNAPIVLGGSKCLRCKEVPHHVGDDAGQCIDGNCHDFVGSIVTLSSMYPHPSLYVRSKPSDCVAFGTKWQPSVLESQHKLLQVAQAFLEDQADGTNALHPISYVAAVLFRDRTHAFARCVKSLEYGCSLDAVALLAPALEAKRKSGIGALQIVQVDQFGIAHPPFAPGRAFLVEHGYGHVSVVMHVFDLKQKSLMWKTVKASELAPMVPDFVAHLNCDGEESTA